MRSRFVSLCLLFILLLSGCTLLQKSDSPPEKTPEETAPAPTEEPEEPEPEVPQGPLNPLTGLETGMTENSVSQKPVGVMISNSSNSLPQWGISQADVIFEMIAEGRITRFLALFQDPSSIWPGALTPCTSISAAVCPPMKRSPGSEKRASSPWTASGTAGKAACSSGTPAAGKN